MENYISAAIYVCQLPHVDHVVNTIFKKAKRNALASQWKRLSIDLMSDAAGPL